jgi:hypothetical protein
MQPRRSELAVISVLKTISVILARYAVFAYRCTRSAPLIMSSLIPVFALVAAEDFPLVGTYMDNEPCKADTPAEARVTITLTEINSPMGNCKILNFKREEHNFAVDVECSGPAGNQLVAKVNFTLHADKTMTVMDQDQSYRAVLYRCQ